MVSFMVLSLQDEVQTLEQDAFVNNARAIKLQREIEKTPCVICNDEKGEDNIVICDGCNRYFHLRCLRPPRSIVPSGDWYCPACDPTFILPGAAGEKELTNLQTPLAWHHSDPYLSEDLMTYIESGHQFEMIQHLPPARYYDIVKKGQLYRPHPSVEGWLLVFKKIRYAHARWLVYPPLHIRWDMIAMFHDAIAHGGISQTMFQLHQHVHWIGIKADVAYYIKNCEACQKVKARLPPEPPVQHPLMYGPSSMFMLTCLDPLLLTKKRFGC
jgi:hypothetical protein